MKTVRMLVGGVMYTGLALAVRMLIIELASAGESDEWLCQRRGNGVLSCGIGTGLDENEARTRAFENAQAEFDRICMASSDCNNHTVYVNPKRTVCRKGIVKDYTCYRLVAFEIGESNEAPRRSVVAKAQMPRRQIQETSGKIRVGMTKKQLLASVGYPDSVDGKRFQYVGALCNFNVCSVGVSNGRVTDHFGVRPEFTNAFE